MARDTHTEREVTTDRERIENWAADHDAVPVRRERGGEEVLELVPESEARETHDEVAWDEFHSELDRGEMVVIYREDERRPFDVVGRNDLISRSTVDSDEVEEQLLAGETVTATLTETTVIEQTIVEEATIESEVVDRAIVESNVVDAELLSRDVDHCDVTDVMADDEIMDFDQLETGHQVEDTVAVEVGVDEGWTVTKEVLEQLTIESRIVDTEATETDTVESDTLEENIDVEGVQQTILEGDMLESEASANEVIQSGSIESQFREGDVVETMLLERKTVEDEVSLRKEFSGELGDGTTVASETITSETVEAEIAADEDLEAVTIAEETTGEPMAGEEETTMSEEETMMSEEETTMSEGETSMTEEETTTVEADAEGGMEEPATAPTPTQAEQGKTVVDATGDEVGMVAEVEGDTVYVDPHPSLTDRIRRVLEWGGRDEDTYPLEADHISRITDDEVQLTVEEDADR